MLLFEYGPNGLLHLDMYCQWGSTSYVAHLFLERFRSVLQLLHLHSFLLLFTDKKYPQFVIHANPVIWVPRFLK